MVQDNEDTVRSGAADRHPPVVPRPVLIAGIATACALGAGAGLWARPSDLDQPAPVLGKPMAAVKHLGKLQIELVQDPSMPQPPRPPPEAASVAVVAASAAPVIVQAAPLKPPAGLIKAQAVELAPTPAPKPEPVTIAIRKLEAAKVLEAPDVQPARPPVLQKTKSEAAAAQKPKLVKARAETRPERKLQVAEKREPTKAKTGKVVDVVDTQTAEAKRPGRLNRFGQALKKVVPAREAAEQTKLAKADEKPAAKSKKEKDAPARLAKAEAEPKKRSAESEEKPVKLARGAKKCASSDLGAALVCADASLSAADRQLARAYREAEAAGVPAWQLKQQQQRWLAARAAAAREAPWAVQDVYTARIAELKDMTRDARQGY